MSVNRQKLVESLRWKKFPVLNDGFVCLVDVMGDDYAIVQAARVSYGKDVREENTPVTDEGVDFEKELKKKYKTHARLNDRPKDRDLIRYLMRHRHTTPFEMAEIKILVRVPMDCWRQWIRHRTACLAGETPLVFSRPCDGKPYRITVADVFERFQPTFNTQRPDKQRNSYYRKERIQDMLLRSVNEDTGEVVHTRIVDVWQTGVKRLFRVEIETSHGIRSIRTSEDHLFLMGDRTWKTLKEIMSLPDSDRVVSAITSKAGVPGPKFNAVDTETEFLCCQQCKILGIVPAGEGMTYDVEVSGPWHNFSADDFVVHNSVNEYSTRYTEAIDSAQTTDPGEWRLQSGSNKQGSSGFLADSEEPMMWTIAKQFSEEEVKFHQQARQLYERRVEAGIAREQARKDLPLSTYTEAYWKIDLHNLLHFLALRMDSHAQQEIRSYANIIGEGIVKPLFPKVWEAFIDYRLEAMYLTRLDVQVVKEINTNSTIEEISNVMSKIFTNDREKQECITKLTRLGFFTKTNLAYE